MAKTLTTHHLMEDEYTTAEEDFLPPLRVQAATQTFPDGLEKSHRNGTPKTSVDDSCSTIQSRNSSDSSYQPSIKAASALSQGFMGTTRVCEGDDGYVNAYNMLTGIRTAVSSVCAKERRKLQPRHFEETREFSFDTSDTSLKAPFKFKDYAPQVFRELRERAFNLDPADYLMSLTGKYIVSALTSPGKSGSFFYYSRDYRFIIKTIHHSEHRRLRQILSEYYEHVTANPDTLISQFYGLHRVTLPFGRNIHFLVMNNVFPALYEVHTRYDLKGSTIGRTSRPTEKQFVVYKDLDWLEDEQKIAFGPKKREEFMKQLKADVRMLQKCGVMDYSLLIGMHDLRQGNQNLDSMLQLHDLRPLSDGSGNYGNVNRRETEEFANFQDVVTNADEQTIQELDLADELRSSFKFQSEKGGYQSTDDNDQPNPIIYYMGLIDFLTYYNTRKRLETKSKGVLHYKEKDGLSAIPALEYGERLLNFISDQIGQPNKLVTRVTSRASHEISSVVSRVNSRPPSLSPSRVPSRTPSRVPSLVNFRKRRDSAPGGPPTSTSSAKLFLSP